MQLSNFREKWQKHKPDVFCKKGVLRNFLEFTGKHLCQSLFFNKVAGLSQVNCFSLQKIFEIPQNIRETPVTFSLQEIT